MTWQREIPKVTVFYDSSRWEFLKLPGWTKATNSAPLPILYQSLTFPLFSDPARTTAPATEEGLVAARSCSPLAGPWWDFSRTIPRRVSTTTDWRWFSLYLVDSPLQPIFQTSCDTKHPMYPILGSTRTIKRDLELLKPCQDKHSDDEGTSDLWIILFFV